MGMGPSKVERKYIRIKQEQRGLYRKKEDFIVTLALFMIMVCHNLHRILLVLSKSINGWMNIIRNSIILTLRPVSDNQLQQYALFMDYLFISFHNSRNCFQYLKNQYFLTEKEKF